MAPKTRFLGHYSTWNIMALGTLRVLGEKSWEITAPGKKHLGEHGS
jgi:hypothetical protein